MKLEFKSKDILNLFLDELTKIDNGYPKYLLQNLELYKDWILN